MEFLGLGDVSGIFRKTKIVRTKVLKISPYLAPIEVFEK